VIYRNRTGGGHDFVLLDGCLYCDLLGFCAGMIKLAAFFFLFLSYLFSLLKCILNACTELLTLCFLMVRRASYLHMRADVRDLPELLSDNPYACSDRVLACASGSRRGGWIYVQVYLHT